MPTVTIEDAQTRLPELIEKLTKDEEVVITRNDLPIARLIPIEPARSQPQFGSCKGMMTIVSDDDEHLEHFKEYMP